MMERGNLYVIAAPSGTGKTSLVKALIESTQDIMVSISHTTRAKRPNEKEGQHYFFVAQAEFENLIKAKEFLEYAKVFDYYYGTSKKAVRETLAKGIDVILEIDWQGHQQIKNIFPHALGIFILPPSFQDLRSRLTIRNQDQPDIIEKRLVDAKTTVAHLHEFDYVVINDDFEQALNDLKIIIAAGRLRVHSKISQCEALIRDLQES